VEKGTTTLTTHKDQLKGSRCAARMDALTSYPWSTLLQEAFSSMRAEENIPKSHGRAAFMYAALAGCKKRPDQRKGTPSGGIHSTRARGESKL